MSAAPRLSILCMSFCRPRGLRLAIESVLAQTYRDWELIICDDASPDPRVRTVFVELMRANPGRLVWISLPGDVDKTQVCTLGCVLNAGIQIMRATSYVTWLGDGVMYLPDRCERMIGYLDAHPDVSFVWGHQQNEDWRDGKIVRRSEHRCGGPPERFAAANLSAILRRQNVIDHCSVIERVSVTLEHAWTEDAAHWRAPDWERWRRIAAAGARADMLPEIGERKRRSPANLGAQLRAGRSIADVAAHRCTHGDGDDRE